MNPANYTVWHFRRKCLHALGLLQQKDAIEKDLGLASLLGGTNPKNYQVQWFLGG
jgi:protein farnesyltransferase/geranylgeranyltransferase type-1 subunit alpha